MDGATPHASQEESGLTAPLRQAQVSCDIADPVGSLIRGLGPGPFDLVCLFVTPEVDFARLNAQCAGRFGDAAVVSCSTAGEIGRAGYEDGQIIAVAFPKALFHSFVHAIDRLDEINEPRVIDALIQRRVRLMQDSPDMAHEFAFLIVDGLSRREESLTDILASGLGPMPLFGGSSGDGTAFRKTHIAVNGRILTQGAALMLIRSRCPVQVFSLDNLQPGEQRCVVTSADPEARVVREINAEPAAAEYARLLGKDPNQLSPFIFAAHPVAVRVGDTHHVRAIQKVNDKGELVFFSAINEGMVLTLADQTDMVAHLDQGLAALDRPGRPHQILGCDCILRRIAASQVQQTRAVSEVLARHRVTGFSTYGEQIGALHVNQTLTGVAIYAPDKDPAA